MDKKLEETLSKIDDLKMEIISDLIAEQENITNDIYRKFERLQDNVKNQCNAIKTILEQEAK